MWAARRASCWSGSQKTAAEDAGTVLSNEVNEECMLVILSSLASSSAVLVEVKTESEAAEVSWSCCSLGATDGVAG